MYPFVRQFKELFIHRNAPRLAVNEAHVSQHICWPWDIDIWMELNNGRSLTLYDLGRYVLAFRMGLHIAMRQNGWGLTMAGANVMWRARIRPFERFETRSRCVGWDEKFVYLQQSMWKRDGRCASQVIYRAAVFDKNGIVPTAKIIDALQYEGETPQLPAWVAAWIKADATRPWPPPFGDMEISQRKVAG